MSSEVQPLLSQSSINSQSLVQTIRICCRPKYLCLSSKAAILIILWTVVVGTTYTFIKDLVAIVINTSHYARTVDVAVLDLIPYAVLAVIMTFYPLSGFIADVCCGRFKTVMISLSFMMLSFVLFGTVCSIAIWITLSSHVRFTSQSHNPSGIVAFILITLTLAFFITGLTGYQANYIQFGLDQLYEAPSEHLGLFVHYASWALSFTSVFDIPLVSLSACESVRKKEELSLFIIVPFILIIPSLILYIVTCWKRHVWFYVEPGHHNPYKTVYSVLNFARKHKYPLRRSAFTYSDSYIPTRIDFAKERYGGPFTTEQVESVKTCLLYTSPSPRDATLSRMPSSA